MTLKQKLQSIEPSRCYVFHRININTVELLIDREGWSGDYSISHARRVCRDLGRNFSKAYKSY